MLPNGVPLPNDSLLCMYVLAGRRVVIKNFDGVDWIVSLESPIQFGRSYRYEAWLYSKFQASLRSTPWHIPNQPGRLESSDILPTKDFAFAVFDSAFDLRGR